MQYIELECTLPPQPEAIEAATALLFELGFEMFTERDEKLYAYIPKDNFSEAAIVELKEKLAENSIVLEYKYRLTEDINWNAEWEASFQPIIVENGEIYVHAAFHPPLEDAKYSILINPKMSFGTGHHETTRLMLNAMLSNDFDNKIILDMGCGTGILAIFASLRNAKEVVAIDIEEWAYRNATENVELNACKNIEVIQGDIDNAFGKTYDIILANINRNVLMLHIPYYSELLADGGKLIMSGFFNDDCGEIVDFASKYKLKLLNTFSENNWACIELIKK